MICGRRGILPVPEGWTANAQHKSTPFVRDKMRINCAQGLIALEQGCIYKYILVHCWDSVIFLLLFSNNNTDTYPWAYYVPKSFKYYMYFAIESVLCIERERDWEYLVRPTGFKPSTVPKVYAFEFHITI